MAKMEGNHILRLPNEQGDQIITIYRTEGHLDCSDALRAQYALDPSFKERAISDALACNSINALFPLIAPVLKDAKFELKFEGPAFEKLAHHIRQARNYENLSKYVEVETFTEKEFAALLLYFMVGRFFFLKFPEELSE